MPGSLIDQILAHTGATRPKGDLGHTAELQRIRGLPERPPAGEELIELMSEWLCPNGAARLRPAQAEALRELYDLGGLFAPMRVGSGKTLVTLLAPTVVEAERPVLLVPAALRAKTERDFREYLAAGWRVRLPRIVSYQALGRVSGAELLDELDPDLLICDEAHYLANQRAAVTKRVRRFLADRADNPDRPIRVAMLSGTLMGSSLDRYAHLAEWALHERSFAPVLPHIVTDWAKRLDYTRDSHADPHTAADQDDAPPDLPGGFHDHARSRRGVVPTPGSGCGASIILGPWQPKLPEELREIINMTENTWTRPDGVVLEPNEWVECMCQLALGFWLTWYPLPPKWWLDPRKAWTSFVRDLIDEDVPGLDSPLQIYQAAAAGTLGPEPQALWAAWSAVRDEFVPNTVARWESNEPLEQAVRWARERNALVWVKHRDAGAKLEELGLPYYGGGTDPQRDAEPGTPIALSIQAHGTGQNLQAWDTNLVLHPPAKADLWEQIIGRTHREGQKSDRILIAPIAAIDYHSKRISDARAEARYIAQASGFEQKLVLADWAGR